MPRLLHVETRQFEEFIGEAVPPYAILSHTWGPNELTFKDVHALGSSDAFPKDPKIDGCCARALQDGYKYVWIDTICLDKSSSAELSEAINSMFDWYFDSDVCYVYLSDVELGEDPLDELSSFRRSRWFTRGWTLQELLAPATVLFFDSGWNCIGRKQHRPMSPPVSEDRDYAAGTSALIWLVADITKISVTVLQSRRSRLHRFQHHNVAEKMSWACRREVTRREDAAYSLLGLFQINMPLLYGEGDRAFQRLQEELIRVSDDETIFAWGFGRPSSHANRTTNGGLLASSLREFELPDGLAIVRKQSSSTSSGIRSDHYQVTNKGILMRKPVRSASRGRFPLQLVPLMCEVVQRHDDGPPKSPSSDTWTWPDWDRSMTLAILVREAPNDDRIYIRARREPISVSSGVFAGKRSKEIYISKGLGPDPLLNPSRIFHINRPRITHHCYAGLGIQMGSSFYPPDMQAVNQNGHNSLLVHFHTFDLPKTKDIKLWAGWREKLRPGMRDTTYFVHFHGALGSFLVMIFPDESTGDHDLPFIPLGEKKSDAISKTVQGPAMAIWQVRVTRLTPLKTILRNRLERLVKGKKSHLIQQLTDLLESSVDPRSLAWGKDLACDPFPTFRFEVTGQVPYSWTLDLEIDRTMDATDDVIRKVRKWEFGKIISVDPSELTREARSHKRAEQRAAVSGGVRISTSSSADWSTSSLTDSSDANSIWVPDE